MRLRKVETFRPDQTQLKRQSPRKPILGIIKFLIFILILLLPVAIWKSINHDVIRCNGIVMGQMELEMGELKPSQIISGLEGEIVELYAESGDRVQKGSLLAIIKPSGGGTADHAYLRPENEVVVVSKNKKVGDFVKKGDVVYEVLPVGVYWIEAFVPEKYINQLSVGQKAQVYITSPYKIFNGKIDFISAEVENMPKMFLQYYYSPKRVFRARISLVEQKMPLDFLKFGLAVKCKIFKNDI